MSSELISGDGQNSKTQVRTIRIPTRLGLTLEKEADAQRISVNALITSVLKKYAEFDRLAEKFEFISMPRKSFSLLIQELDDDKIEKCARQVGSTVPKEIMRFWFDELSLGSLMSFMSLLSRHYRLVKSEIKVNYSDYTIMLHHDMGMKWSKFLKYYLDEAIRGVPGILPKFEISDGLVVIRFNARDAVGNTQISQSTNH